jgi:hypothetical protein
MIERALHYRDKRPIFSNMGLSWAEDFQDWNELIGLRCCLILLDEAAVWFNSRDWKGFPREVASFLMQSRKEGVDLWFTAQSEAGVDANLRRLVSTYYSCERFGPFIRQTIYDGQAVGASKGYTRWTLLRKRVMDAYDTYQVVGYADGSGRKRGAAADNRMAQRLKVLLKESYCVDEPHPGRSVWRPATLDDVCLQREIVSRVEGKWKRVDFEAIEGLWDYLEQTRRALGADFSPAAPCALVEAVAKIA